MKKLENELSATRQSVVEMGNLTEQMISTAIDFVMHPDQADLSSTVSDAEVQLDNMQLEIDKEAIRLLTVYSPVAADLRFIMSVSRITSELERMGDHAVNMCQFVQLLASKTDASPLPDVKKMATMVKGMVCEALNAFLQNDIIKAQTTIAQDDMVDALNDQIVEQVLDIDVVHGVMDEGAEKKAIAGALAQILIARSLERVADQATNISEEVVYMVKGRDIRHPESVRQMIQTDAT